jgi:hypothetical protein
VKNWLESSVNRPIDNSCQIYSLSLRIPRHLSISESTRRRCVSNNSHIRSLDSNAHWTRKARCDLVKNLHLNLQGQVEITNSPLRTVIMVMIVLWSTLSLMINLFVSLHQHGSAINRRPVQCQLQNAAFAIDRPIARWKDIHTWIIWLFSSPFRHDWQFNDG